MTVFRASPTKGAAWITGASAGIGRALALELADRGYTVYASARGVEKLEELASQSRGPGRIIALPLDVTDRQANAEAIQEIVAQSGRLALAVLNAGNYYPVRGHKLSFEPFEQSMNINFDGVLNGLLPAIESMKQAGGGQIAIVSSSASYGGLPNSAAYGATKAALVNLAASLKFDLDPLDIRLQVVTPGFVETPLTDKNDFPMPFLMKVDDAARAFANGLEKGGFDITFPKRFTLFLKAVNLLPYWAYFRIVAGFTGVNRGSRR